MRGIKNHSHILSLFIRLVSVLIILEIIVFLAIVQFYDSHKKDLILTHEKELLKTLRNQLVFSLDRVESDIKFLSNYIENEYDASSEFEYNVSLKLSMFSSAKMIYDQIRILDTTGMEWIRVNLENNTGVLVADSLLQNKADRYYFKNSINIGKNSVFVSPLDLNIENGEIELPHKAMIRFAKPLFDAEGRKFGVLILNYLADTLLKEFRRESADSKGRVFLTNTEGYFFIGPNPEEEWGFMFANKQDKKMQYLMPEVWQLATIADKNQAILDDGIISHANIEYLIEQQKNSSLLINDTEAQNYNRGDSHWHIISYVDKQAVAATMHPLEQQTFIVLLILFIGLNPVLYFLAKNISMKRAAIKRLIENKAELSELNAMKDKLFSIIAHDLRNPLQVLILSSELLKVHFEKKYYEKMEKDIYKLINTTNSFKELLESLLTWSRSQAGKIPFERQPFNLAEICNKSIQVCKGNADLKEIEIVTQDCEDHEVLADPHMISTVFQNLLFNAIKFTPNQGTITIKFRDTKKFIEVSVIDTGVGMTEEEIKNILKIDVHFTKRGTSGEAGSGIGILLCKEFIEKHGGIFDIESEVDVGSKFTFTIPKIRTASLHSVTINKDLSSQQN